MTEQEILQQVGRQGWRVVARRPETRAVTVRDENNNPTQQEQQTGNDVWDIQGPGGQPDSIVVQQHYGPEETPGYTVVKGPEKQLQQPQPAAGYTDVKGLKNADGSTTYYGRNAKTGNFEKIQELPTEPAPTKPITPANQLETVKGPDGTPIALRDPASGQVIDLPRTTADKPQIVQGPRGQIYKWDGTNLTTLQQGEPAPVTPKEGDSYQAIESGRNVTKTYRGGQWVTTNVGDSAVPGTAKEGDSYQAVEGGYNVTKTYRSGQWVTTAVGTKATPQDSTTLSAPVNQRYIVQQIPGQSGTQNIENPNYVAPDVGGRVQQIQQQARVERDRLQNDPTLDDQQRQQRFDEWWQTTVQPQVDQLQRDQAQQTSQAQRQATQDQTAAITAESTYESGRQTTARQAGQDAVSRVMQTLPYRVGPNFGTDFSKALSTLSGGGGQVNFSPSDFTFDMPNLDQISEQATASALAHISPYAAMKANAPMPQIPPGVDIGSALSNSRYSFGGGAPTTTIAPDGTVTIQHQPTGVPGGGRGNLDAYPTPTF